MQACVGAGIAGAELLGQADQRLREPGLGDWQPHSVAAALNALASARHRPPDAVLQHASDTAARCLLA